MPPDCVVHFFESVTTGQLPGNTECRTHILTSEEAQLFPQHYIMWAPAPQNELEKSPMDQVMKRVGSHEDSARLIIVEKDIHAMKSRLWEGLTPMTLSTWHQKDLSNPSPNSFGCACQHISLVIETFAYLNEPKTQANLRDTFNLIWHEFKPFQDAINTLRAQKPEHEREPPIELCKYWEEYIRATYRVMVTRAHTWVLDRIQSLRGYWLPLSDNQVLEGTPTPRQWQITNAWHVLLELSTRADYTIFMPMNGYIGATAEENALPPLDQRRRTYVTRLKQLSRAATLNSVLQNPAHRETLRESHQHQLDEQVAVRREVRGLDPSVTNQDMPEQWIIRRTIRARAQGKGLENMKFGFVIYKLFSYTDSSEWSRFLADFSRKLGNWGAGIPGLTPEIKRAATLHWIDGKEMGLPENDIEAAKTHFTAFVETEEFSEGFNDDTFLVVNDEALKSHTEPAMPNNPNITPPPDLAPYIVAVEAGFDKDEPYEHPDECPGYEGMLRIQDGLIWSDLYVFLATQSQFLDDMWGLVIDHPCLIYIGQVVKKQKDRWKELKEAQVWCTGAMVEGVRERNREAGRADGRAPAP